MALGVVGSLVWALVALVGMLDLSADGETETPQATTVGATPSATPESSDTDADEAARAERRAAARAQRAAEQAEEDGDLAEPDGPCAPGDVVVTPTITDAHAARPVTVELELTTESSPACTWDLDPDDVFVTIEDGTSTLWSSQDCPSALPSASTVPRSSTPDVVRFTWNAKESVPGCAVDTSWLFPGTYKVTAVARGSVDPVESLFTLGAVLPARAADGTDGSEDTDGATDEEREGRDAGADDADGSATTDEDAADDSEPETEEQAAERRENRREALREARRQHRQDDAA